MFQTLLFEKGADHPLWKLLPFLRPDAFFFGKWNKQTFFRFHIEKSVLSNYRMMSRMLDLLWWIANFEDNPVSVYLGTLCVRLTYIYNKKWARFWFLLIDLSCISPHVKFQAWLSISVLRNTATLLPKKGFKTVEFIKSTNLLPPNQIYIAFHERWARTEFTERDTARTKEQIILTDTHTHTHTQIRRWLSCKSKGGGSLQTYHRLTNLV